MSVEELIPAVIRQALSDRRAKTPFRRLRDADFGPRWLIPTWEGAKRGPDAEISYSYMAAPPWLVEWARVVATPLGQPALLTIECFDHDQRANEEALVQCWKDYEAANPGQTSPNLTASVSACGRCMR